MKKIFLIFTIFIYCIFSQDVSNSVTEFTSDNFYQYHNKGNWIIEFNRNGLASVFLDRLVEWKNSKSYNINIAKLNIDKHTDVSNIIDGSPAAPYPHYMLFYDGLAVSFVGSADFETVSEFIEGFILRNTQSTPQTGEEATPQTVESTNEQPVDTTQDQTSELTQQTVESTNEQPIDETVDPNVESTNEQPIVDGQEALVDGIDQTFDPNAEYTYDPNAPNTAGTEDNYEVVFNPETGQYEYVFPEITFQDETGAEIQQDGELPTDEVERQLESDATDLPDQNTPVEGTTEDNTPHSAEGTVVDTTQDIPVQETVTVIAPAPSNPDEVDETNIVVLTNTNFDERISSGIWFIEFYAPWCGFCKRLIPTWAQLANTFQDDSNINIAKLDATENDVAERFNVRGYPTLLLLRDGQVYDYEGERDINALVNFINNGYLNSTSTPIPSKSQEINQEDVVVLNTSNFASSVSNGVWLVEFYAPWCGFCKQLTPVWAQLATELKAEGINVAKVDVDVEKELSLTYNIEYLPTIYVIADKKLYKQDGEKDRQSLLEFARGGYKTVTPTDLPSAEVDESDIVVLKDSNYKDLIEKGAWFIEFYAPWCGFCKKLKPTWAQLATKYKGNQNVRIAMSDANENTELAEKFGVESFPTIYLFLNGRKYPFGGNRTVESFSSFIESGYKEVEHKSLPLDSTNILDSDVVILDDKNLTSSISKGEWLIEFYAPWCGFCKTLKPIYSNLATYVKNKYDSKFNVAKLDVDQNGQMAAAFGIRYLPTIFYVKDGKLYKNNRGRSFDDIFKFATETVNDESTISFPLPNFVENPTFDEKDVTVLTDANFDATVKNAKFWLIEFYAPWCGHCKKLAPNWAQLASFAKQRMGADYGIAKIDGTANPKVAEKFDDIKGYPTILFFDTEKNTYVEYEGGRSIPEFYEFLTEERTKVAEDKIKKVYESVEEKNKAKADGVEELVAADFYEKVSTGIWLVDFYAPWCGFCKRLAPEYAQFHKTVKAEWDSKYHVGKVNVDVEKELGEHFNIEYLPTLLVLTEGKAYKLEGAGNANLETLSKFLKGDYLTVTPKPFERKEITQAPASPPAPAPAPPADVSEEDVVVLGDSDFVPNGKISSGIWFVEFYAPWCGFCKQLTPVWSQLAKDLKAEGGNFHVAKLDATVHEEAAALFSVSGYPTLIVIENGKFVEYLGGRELEDMKKYLKGVYQGQTLTAFKYLDGTVAAKENTEAAPSGIEDDSDVVVLKDSNFFNKISTGTWIVDFYAPWCGHCKVLAPKWNLLAKQLKGKVNVGKVDITTEERLSEAFGPKYLPTIYLIHNGFYYKFDGKREVPELTHFAQVSYKKFDAKKLPPSFMSVEETSAEYLITLTDENFWPQISKGEWFIEFYAPWCGFCKQLAPIYTQFSFEAHTSIPSLSVAQVNAEDNSVAASFNVRSYPTLVFLKDGKYYNFEGLRTVEGMSEFSKTGYLKVTGVDVPEQPVVEIRPKESRERKVFTKKIGNIQQLDNTNFDRLTSSGNWLISFNVPYDGFSKQLGNVLADLTDSSFNIKVSVGSVDSVKNHALAERFSITKFPSLVLLRDDKQYVLDSSITNLAKIKEFIESKYKSSTSTKRRVANHDEL